jgi:hypothetical protein
MLRQHAVPLHGVWCRNTNPGAVVIIHDTTRTLLTHFRPFTVERNYFRHDDTNPDIVCTAHPLYKRCASAVLTYQTPVFKTF